MQYCNKLYKSNVLLLEIVSRMMLIYGNKEYKIKS